MKNTDDFDKAYYDYYDNHDFTEDIELAKKNGDALYCKAGENPIEAFKLHMETKAQKTTPTSVFTRPAQRRAVAAAML